MRLGFGDRLSIVHVGRVAVEREGIRGGFKGKVVGGEALLLLLLLGGMGLL